MDFRYSAYFQRLLSLSSKAEKIKFFLQKNLTHVLPVSEEEFLIKLNDFKTHIGNFQNYYSGKNIDECIYYEFGSGYDMVLPITMSLKGFKKLKCVDIRELVFPELINDSIKRLKEIKNNLAFEFDLNEIPKADKKNYKEFLQNFFRIEYEAPFDARKTNIPDGAVDFILTNATLEHISSDDLKKIFFECYRILSPGGIMSNIIDYRDHWSFNDNSIGVYNFLRFSEKEWRKYNPLIMLQNRMRHVDYLRLISETDFEIVDSKIDLPTANELKQLKSLELDTYFEDNYSIEDLSIKSSILVLRKNE